MSATASRDGVERGARVTIADVASRAGVSIATVSRVMNDRYGVAAPTIHRVREVIDELGYESSLIARSLRSQRTNVIGILVSDIEPFSAELLKGAAKALRDSDYELVDLLRFERPRGLGAALSVAPRRDARRRHHPRRPHGGRGQRITSGGRRRPASRRLVPCHRRCPELRGCRRRDGTSHRARPPSNRFPRRPREIWSQGPATEAGYCSALEAAGIAFDPDLVQAGGFTEETTAAARARCSSRSPTGRRRSSRPTTCRRSRSSVPPTASASTSHHALSIVGFDNIPESALTDPPLTTVDQSIQGLGYEAVRAADRADRTTRPTRRGGPGSREVAHRTRRATVERTTQWPGE